METMFLQDKDRIVTSATFPTYRRTVSGGENEDDTLLSVRFEAEQWEILAQNAEEKNTILHLLECIGNNLSADKTAELGKQKGLIGVDKRIMKHGVLLRKAKTAYKKDERYIVVVPGKLLLFMTPNIVGKHVRYVTTLVNARVQLSRSQLVLEIMVPNTKDLAFSAASMEGLSSWVKTIEASANGETKSYHSSADSSDSGGSRSSNDAANYSSPRGRRRGHRHHRRRQVSGEGVSNYIEPDPNYMIQQQQQKFRTRPNPHNDNNYMRYAHDDDWPPTSMQRAAGPPMMQLAAGPVLPPAAATSGPSKSPPANVNAMYNNYPNMQFYDDQQHRPPYIVSEPDSCIDDTNTQGGVDKNETAGDNIEAGADQWATQKTNYKNVQTRRRSVPLQCLDSALEEMTFSIGNIGIAASGAAPASRPPGAAVVMQVVPTDNTGQQLNLMSSSSQPSTNYTQSPANVIIDSIKYKGNTMKASPPNLIRADTSKALGTAIRDLSAPSSLPHQSEPSSSSGGGKKPPNLTRADTKAYGAIMQNRIQLPALPGHNEYAVAAAGDEDDRYYNTSMNPSTSPNIVSDPGNSTYAATTSNQTWQMTYVTGRQESNELQVAGRRFQQANYMQQQEATYDQNDDELQGMHEQPAPARTQQWAR